MQDTKNQHNFINTINRLEAKKILCKQAGQIKQIHSVPFNLKSIRINLFKGQQFLLVNKPMKLCTGYTKVDRNIKKSKDFLKEVKK